MVGDDWIKNEVDNLEKPTSFWILLGVLTCFNVFCPPILDNRTTTFWIEGYGQIYGVSSAAGGALGHVRGFL